MTLNKSEEIVLFPNAHGSVQKWFAISVATISGIVLTPIFVCAIKFEKDQHKRTLLSQLFSSFMFGVLVWNFVIQPTTTLRFIFGPVKNHFLCSMDTLLKNVVPMYGILLLTIMPIVRYLFLFHTKNVCMVNESFWCIFLTIWSALSSLLSQSVFVLSPGKNTINYYMCMDSYPQIFSGMPVKPNPTIIVIGFLCVGVNSYVYARIFMFKVKNKMFSVNPNTPDSIVTFTFNTCAAFSTFAISYIMPFLINNREPEFLDHPEHLLLLYVQHFYSNVVNQTFLLFLILVKTPRIAMRFINYLWDFVK